MTKTTRLNGILRRQRNNVLLDSAFFAGLTVIMIVLSSPIF